MTRPYASVSDLPGSLPVFPLSGALLLPGGILPLNIFEPRYIAMFDDALGGDRLIGMIQPTDPNAHDPKKSDEIPALFPVGCAGRITSFSETGDGRYLVTLSGLARFKMARELEPRRGYRRVAADWTAFSNDMRESECSLDRPRFVNLLQSYFQLHGLSANWESVEHATNERLLTTLAMVCPLAPGEKQALLEAPCHTERAQIMMTLLEIAVAGGDGDTSRH